MHHLITHSVAPDEPHYQSISTCCPAAREARPDERGSPGRVARVTQSLGDRVVHEGGDSVYYPVFLVAVDLSSALIPRSQRITLLLPSAEYIPAEESLHGRAYLASEEPPYLCVQLL